MSEDKKVKKISTAELARTLGWNYEDAKKVRQRQAPKARFKMMQECEAKLLETLDSLSKEFNQ